MLTGHGDDLYLYGGKIKYNFSSNVCYEGCKPALQQHLSDEVKTMQNYPSPVAQELNDFVANRYKLTKSQCLFTNGATEAFYLLAQCFSDKRAAILAPTFAEYEDACKIHQVSYDLVERTHRSFGEYGLVFLCNPNNPDGSIIDNETLEDMLKHNPTTIFVVDEAYIEFTLAVKSVISWVITFSNLVVVRSLTKSFAVAGLRLGYVVSNAEIISNLLSTKMPWSVNALAIAAAKEIFKNYDDWLPNPRHLLEETFVFAKQLNSIEFIKIIPSHTTYFLAEILKGSVSELKQYLAAEHGILVRDATNFKYSKGEFIRLATQNTQANEQLIKALKTWN